MDPCQVQTITSLLDRTSAGDPAAIEELVALSMPRLKVFVRRELKDFRGIRQFESSDDVVQSAATRLWKALHEVRPETPDRYFGLCSLMIRRTLLDMHRKYYGPEGDGTHQVADTSPDGAVTYTLGQPMPLQSVAIHAAVDALPDEQRQVVDLLFYQGLTHAEAAAVLSVSTKWISRRWRDARLNLQHRLGR